MYSKKVNSTLIDLAEQLKALGDQTRLALVVKVASSASSEACVCDLTDIAGLTQEISKRAVSIYDYENKVNEDKRNINIMKDQYVTDLEYQFKRLME